MSRTPKISFNADPESRFSNNLSDPTGLSGPVQLGAISFINTIPVYYPFHFEQVVSKDFTVKDLPVDTTLTYAPPSALNEMMLRGELDVSPVSSAFYLRHQDRFTLLSDLSVSSYGSVDSVILLSKLPFGPRLLELESIGVPDSSETSIALLTHLLLEELGEEAMASRLKSGWLQVYPAQHHEQALKAHQAILMIGDDALRMVQENAQRKHQDSNGQEGSDPYYFTYDLATLWQEKTGLPFVFAVWIAQKDWGEKYPKALETLNGFLVSARSCFFESPPTLTQGIALAKEKSDLDEQVLGKYFTASLNYQLKPDHLEALSLFEGIIEHLDQKGWEVSIRSQLARSLSDEHTLSENLLIS